MLKRKIAGYIEDFYRTSKRALMLTGARQVGKTFSIREFGRRNFKSFIEINFIETPDAVRIFSNVRSSEDIFLRLSAITEIPMIEGDTLIFFDEVEQCPELVTAIKFLVDDGRYRYILSGSMLGVELKNIRSVPVGYMGIKEMFPLDLEEFMWAVGVDGKLVAHLRNAWETKTAVDEFVHKKMLEVFRLYLVVGGMPDAVMAYKRSNNMRNVMSSQEEIIKLYRKDISQYDAGRSLKIKEVFDLIPSELNAKNKRFFIKDINAKARIEMYEDEFLWLKDAGVALPVYNIEEPKVPLTLASSRRLFKLFSNDVGLLACQYSDGLQLKILTGNEGINFGAVYENVVAQELRCHGFEDLYFYNSKKMGELDFVAELNGAVFPIEVKSGKDYTRHRALNNLIFNTEYDIPEALVLCNDNLSVDGNITYAPVYMLMFLVKNPSLDLNYTLDLTGLQV